MEKSLQIMVVAGEASGDAQAAKLVRALRTACSNEVSFFGCAGPRMREEGVEAIVEADDLSIVGLLEIAAALPKFVRVFRKLKAAARERRPDTVILVDFPDFNLKLVKPLKRLGIKVVYYISPQLWAWRQYRQRTIRNNVDLLISILPFEKDWYNSRGIYSVEYAGNPLAMEVHADVTRSEFRNQFEIAEGRKLIALLPGSRRAEIQRMLPVFAEAAAEIRAMRADVDLLVALPEDKREQNERLAQEFPSLRFVYGRTYDALNAADAAAVTSGTATLEAGIIGTPMVIVYKTSALNYKLLRPLIDVEHFGLINLIAGKRVVREMIQDDLTSQELAAELLRLLEPAVNKEKREELADAVEKLGHGGASRRAAEAIIRLIENRGPSA
jgi:lipid-A-disaccharide synthase